MEILFLMIYLLFVFVNKRKVGSLVNGQTIVFAPYTIIIIINNYVFTKFYRIENGSIAIMLLGMIVYQLTFLAIYSRRYNKKTINIRDLFYCEKPLDERINYRLVELIVLIIILYRLIAVLFIYLGGGLSAITANNYNALNLGPIGGRLIIFLYPLGWLLFNNSFNELSMRQRRYDLVLSLIIILIHVMSYIKAHAIIYIIGLYIIACIRNERNIVRGGVLLLGTSVLIFFVNYALRWFAIDSSVPSLEYTINHFWKYVAGGTINLNGTAFSGTTNYYFFDYWIQILSPIPNEFTSIIGLKLNVYSGSYFPYISNMALVSGPLLERSNVVNIFGFFYGSGGINIIGFVVNTIIYALFTEWAVYNVYYPKAIYQLILAIACLTYSFLSFFSLYFSTSAFWQICFYSGLVIWMFSGGVKQFSREVTN